MQILLLKQTNTLLIFVNHKLEEENTELDSI